MSRLSRWISSLRKKPDANLYVSIGRGSYVVGPNAFRHIEADGPVTIGQFCSIAADVIFLGPSGNHRMDTASTSSIRGWSGTGNPHHHFSKGPTIIGNDVWIATRSIILGGVTIGDGAVIGAGSVVTKDVPPYCIHAGNPAKFIRRRFDEETALALQAIAWWDWPDEKIKAEADAFHDLEAKEFVARHT